jgi:hypothetical protein
MLQDDKITKKRGIFTKPLLNNLLTLLEEIPKTGEFSPNFKYENEDSGIINYFYFFLIFLDPVFVGQANTTNEVRLGS